MTDPELRVNPIYGQMLSVVNEAMLEAGLARVSPCPDPMPPCELRQALQLSPSSPEPYPYSPTRHEVWVLRCGDLLIKAHQGPFLEYSVQPPLTADPVQLDTLSVYARCASRFPITLRWALLLHDIAKDRYPRPLTQEAPDLAGAEHPKLCKETVQGISAYLLGRSKALGEYRMSHATLELVLWLVEHHDVLGNMFTGERAPRFLLDQGGTPAQGDVAHWLSLLQVVTLCDLWATADGKFLTEQKARYWLSLGDRGSVESRQRELYDWRIQRWTGDLSGVGNPQAAAYVKVALAVQPSQGSSRRVEEVFGDAIDHIVYGFYLFTALNEAELAVLLGLAATEYNKRVPKGTQSMALAFQKYKPWEPDTQAVLEAYRAQIRDGRLDCEYDGKSRTLRVVALRQLEGRAQPDAVAELRAIQHHNAEAKDAQI